MTIKVKVTKNNKAVVKWKHPMEKDWFLRNLCMLRDGTAKGPFKMTIKDVEGKNIKLDLPRPPLPLPNQKAQIVNPNPQSPQKIVPPSQDTPLGVQMPNLPPPTNPKLQPNPDEMKAVEIRPETKKGE